jgi:hypothetical protein
MVCICHGIGFQALMVAVAWRRVAIICRGDCEQCLISHQMPKMFSIVHLAMHFGHRASKGLPCGQYQHEHDEELAECGIHGLKTSTPLIGSNALKIRCRSHPD